jgi:HSP20 family molecular chaperone IbpA|tara:strand:+ start:103 stop:1380 length:1278 start_codon:yes stop_codon:yes gene_type:complete
MMLTTSLRPFHVLDSALASELDDLFFDAVDAIAVPSNGGVPDAMLFDDTTNATTTRYHHHAKREHRRVETKETNRGTLIQMNVPGASSKDVTVTARGSGTLQSKGVSISNVPTSSVTVALPSSSLEIKLRRKATHDIENAKAAVMDGVLRIAVPKITIPVVAIPVASGKIEATRRPAEESEVCLKFAVAGYSSNDISIELDAERERLKITGELEDKSSEFERVVPVPRGLSAEHVTLCAVENGILEIRLRDPLAIEKRVVPVFSTSPPQSLPSSKETPQPMSTINEDEGDVKTEQEKDNRVVLMKTEVPGFSSKDIECFINVDRTIEAKRGDRSAKIGIPNQINIDSINAYCEHGIFQVLGERVPPSSQESVVVPVASPSDDREKEKTVAALDAVVEDDDDDQDRDAAPASEKGDVARVQDKNAA